MGRRKKAGFRPSGNGRGARWEIAAKIMFEKSAIRDKKVH